MQRVLTFQMARGFGESSEFVTKRMCFSFLFSIGFLCLLGGFMLGRFAAERTIHVKAEKTRLELADNGLEMTEYLQQRVLKYLEDTKFFDDLNKDPDKLPGAWNNINNTKDIFSELIFVQKVFQTKSCTVAKVRGSRESDRYVVLSITEKGSQILKQLARSFNMVYEEQDWKPRRSILFCLCEHFSQNCYDQLPNYMKLKIVAFITMPDSTFQNSINSVNSEDSCILVSGSNIPQSTVLQSADFLRISNTEVPHACSKRSLISVPQFDFDVPHAVLSFVNAKNHSLTAMDNKILAQMIGLSLWRLSESIIFPWNPKNLNETILGNLQYIETSKFNGSQENDAIQIFRKTTQKLIEVINKYSEKLNVIDKSNSLKVRIANDRLLDLDKILLCLSQHQPQSLERTEECYKYAEEILQA